MPESKMSNDYPEWIRSNPDPDTEHWSWIKAQLRNNFRKTKLRELILFTSVPKLDFRQFEPYKHKITCHCYKSKKITDNTQMNEQGGKSFICWTLTKLHYLWNIHFGRKLVLSCMYPIQNRKKNCLGLMKNLVTKSTYVENGTLHQSVNI
jgi:hypothetical protein